MKKKYKNTMDKENFTFRKENLIQLIATSSSAADVSAQYKQDLETALKILNEYTFANRLQLKGTLTHTLVDSLSLYDALAEKLIEFDQAIK